MYKIAIPFLLFFLASQTSYSQTFKKFTEEPEAYLEEMDALFARDETNYKKGKELLKEFETPWLEGGFSAQKQKEIYEISNLLLKRRARNFPHFYEYIKTVIAFQQYSSDSLNYIEWEKGIKFLATKKKSKLRDINTFIKSTYNLITKNAIYYSNSIQWFSNNSNYKLLLENDTLKFVFPDLTLTGKLRKDSIQIHETSGTFFPLTRKWVGNSAKVYWQKTGLDKDIAWAEIGKYSFQMNKASYSIKNIKFYNKTYFDYPLTGTLKDKIVEVKSPDNLSYPRFESNQTNFTINGIFKDINYKGGFSMQGNKLIGTGTKQQYATLSFYRDVELVRNGDTVIEKQLFMNTQSQYYAFKQDEIISRNCKISIRIDKDSIYHPGLMLRYFDKNREINLIRDNNPENLSRSPYYNTYHKIEMNFELLKWEMDKTDIDFTMLRGSSINIAQFESQDYFSAERYYEVRGYENLHPYISLRRFSRHYNTTIIYDEDLAQYMGYPLTPIRRMLIDFTYRGIVDYDSETGYCTLKPKLFQYLDAIVGKKDYDLIQFESQTLSPMNNAVLNLQNMDLAIQGVPVVNVSDSQNVVFYPKNQEILLKKNRNFDFKGRVEVGFFTFYGNNFQFKYDSFKVALNSVDSLSIKVKSGVDNWGRQVLANVQNVIEDVSGDVVIDDPSNKSGIKSNPEFPIFESKQESYVYWDAKNIQKGKYTRDRFYFIVDAYTIDSLNNFTPEGMGYEGVLYSADIFPVIKQRLVLQPDNSLGFHNNTPEEGLPLFKGKGHYYADIHLSNKGLRGDGRMEYLTSTTVSEDFIFFPDSANTITKSFDIRKQIAAVQYPEVKADKINMHWMPYQDKLYANTIDNSFTMYESKSKHTGDLLYTPKQLTGSGTSRYYKGELESQFFKFKADKFNADTSNFKLKSINPEMLAFSTKNVESKVDFIAMKSSFRANSGTTMAELPENLYQAYIEKFNWFMEKETMQLSTPNTVQVYERGKNRIVNREAAGLNPKGSLFVSVHSGQDSLNWVSAEADFNLKTNTIFAHQVKFIEVADATIYPNEGEIVIEPVAYMKTLLKAQVLANMETKYHRFHSATINISSRKKYHGQGKYDYEDEIGRFQSIIFSMIAVDSTGQTFARGNIRNIDDFSLSPAFKFRGNVKLEAKNPLLYFDGHTQINHECSAFSENWLKFETEINPQEIFIPLEEQPKDINDAFLVSGAMLATDSIHIFPTFISPRKRYSNLPIMTASGFLTYRKKDKTYIIGEKSRIANADTTGNILTLHKNFCNLYGEGDIDLTAKLGQIKIETKGNGIYKLEEDRFKLDLLMTVDFFFPEACIKYIADTIASMTALRPVNLKSRTYTQGMKELLPYKVADQMLKEQSIFGTVKKVPKELLTTFVFSDLTMTWNKKEDAWQSTGDLGIANILGTQINRKIGGNISITKKRSGDSFDLYIEISETHWYYFNYKRGLMQAYSSEADFNEIIANIKGSDRKLKIERGESSYVFFLSNKKKRNDYLKRLGKKIDDNDKKLDYEQYDDFD